MKTTKIKKIDFNNAPFNFSTRCPKCGIADGHIDGCDQRFEIWYRNEQTRVLNELIDHINDLDHRIEMLEDRMTNK